jgi:hypothetical protein
MRQDADETPFDRDDTPWDGDEEIQRLDAALARLEVSLERLAGKRDQMILTTKRLVMWGNVILSLELAIGFGLVAWLR